MADSRICSVEGCDKPHYGKGFCSKHYLHWHRYGTPKRVKNDAAQFLKDLLEKFRRNEFGDECIEWPFAKIKNGYGVVNSVNYDSMLVTRIVCSEVNGKASETSLECCHSCGNPPCVNPKHLRWGTRHDNMNDALIHGTRVRGEMARHAKLTEQQAKEVKRLKGHMKVDEAAERFGVSRWTIYDVWNGRSWGWLE